MGRAQQSDKVEVTAARRRWQWRRFAVPPTTPPASGAALAYAHCRPAASHQRYSAGHLFCSSFINQIEPPFILRFYPRVCGCPVRVSGARERTLPPGACKLQLKPVRITISILHESSSSKVPVCRFAGQRMPLKGGGGAGAVVCLFGEPYNLATSLFSVTWNKPRSGVHRSCQIVLGVHRGTRGTL